MGQFLIRKNTKQGGGGGGRGRFGKSPHFLRDFSLKPSLNYLACLINKDEGEMCGGHCCTDQPASSHQGGDDHIVLHQ